MKVRPALLALAVFGASAAEAQDPDSRALTLADIHSSSKFAGESFQMGRWASDGPVVLYVADDSEADTRQEEPRGATSLVRYNLQTGEESTVVSGERLRAPDTGELIAIENYAFSTDGRRVLIFTDSEPVWRQNTKGYYYIYDLSAGTVTPLSSRESGFQMFAKFSPDGSRVGFVRDRNLFVVDIATRRERQLTFDGSEGQIINGTFDWVYEEEFGLRDGWSWAPDGSRIAFFKLDESSTREFAMADLRNQYPSFQQFRYPKAGESNSDIKVGVLGVDTGSINYIDTGTWASDAGEHEYIARMGWTPDVGDGSRVWLFRLNRNQNQVDLMFADPDTLAPRLILTDSSRTWVDVGSDKLTFLEDGRHFVWMSERDGHNHLYLYNMEGYAQTAITSGPWDVTDFHGVDENSGLAYFTATIDNPLERHVYRIEIPGGAMENSIGPSPERITAGNGSHSVDFSDDLQYYIDTWSSTSTPPVVTLHDESGAVLDTLEANRGLIDLLAQYDLPALEFTTIPGADSTLLNAYLIKPRDFDSTREYPLLLYVYGGPGSQTVIDSWGGTRYLWHALLAEEHGFIVASIDNRGTGGRGKEFKSQTHRRLGQIEAADQIAAAAHLAELPYIDEDRIGIWGWSYGGYMTLMSMLSGEGPETFAVGIAVAPVTDWRLYDTIYTERFMSTPVSNPKGYELGAPLTYADRLREEQSLLIVHGDLDDNVHFQQTLQMVDRLQAANKQFDMMMYPGRNHSIYGDTTRLHLYTLMTDYLVGHLGSGTLD